MKQREFVLALWLEGADAHGRVDEYSDIDLWLDVVDGHEAEALEVVREVLDALGPLELAVEVDHPHPLIRQAFYRLAGAPEFLMVDACVQSNSREFMFTRGMAGERALVLLDRAGVVHFHDLDERAWRVEMLEWVARLEGKLAVYPTWVRKELGRGKFLEALGAYHEHVLEPLVEALRLRHAPSKAGFHLKGASGDLPAEVVDSVADLYRVRDEVEIGYRLPEALELLSETLTEVRAILEEASSSGRPEGAYRPR